MCLRFAISNCSKKLQNIFEIGFKKCRVIVQKSLSKKKSFEIENSQTRFCRLHVTLATVRIWGQLNNFPFSYNSLKCLLQAKNLFEKTALKKIFCFANKLRPQTPLTGFSDNWTNQCRESLLPITSWWNSRVNFQKTLVFRNALKAPKAERQFFCSSVFLEAGHSGKMEKTKKDTNAWVAGRRKQIKDSAAEQLCVVNCAWIIF